MKWLNRLKTFYEIKCLACDDKRAEALVEEEGDDKRKINEDPGADKRALKERISGCIRGH